VCAVVRLLKGIFKGMKIPEFCKGDNQMSQLGRHHWNVARLFQLSKDLKVMDIPLDHLNVHNIYEKLTMRDMVMHMKAIQSADLKHPIILDEDGEIMDGRHRVMKAMLTGKETIKAVRFDANPAPCKIDD